ncbi:hypothetical protein GCM10009743_17080 [Kribbella swartbergensis]
MFAGEHLRIRPLILGLAQLVLPQRPLPPHLTRDPPKFLQRQLPAGGSNGKPSESAPPSASAPAPRLSASWRAEDPPLLTQHAYPTQVSAAGRSSGIGVGSMLRQRGWAIPARDAGGAWAMLWAWSTCPECRDRRWTG